MSMSDNMSHSDTEFQIGEDLYGISVVELETRITRLQAEMTRIKAELDKKKRDLSAADLLFSSKK